MNETSLPDVQGSIRRSDWPATGCVDPTSPKMRVVTTLTLASHRQKVSLGGLCGVGQTKANSGAGVAMRRWPSAVFVLSVLVMATVTASVAGAATARDTSSVPKLTKLWTARLAGPGSAPVIADGKVFVTAIKPKLPVHA